MYLSAVCTTWTFSCENFVFFLFLYWETTHFVTLPGCDEFWGKVPTFYILELKLSFYMQIALYNIPLVPAQISVQTDLNNLVHHRSSQFSTYLESWFLLESLLFLLLRARTLLDIWSVLFRYFNCVTIWDETEGDWPQNRGVPAKICSYWDLDGTVKCTWWMIQLIQWESGLRLCYR